MSTVGDGKIRDVPILDLVGNGGRLPEDDLLGLSGLPLVQLLPDADDDLEALLQGVLDLLGDQVVRLAKDVAPLGVAQDDPLAAQVLDHRRGDLTCKKRQFS